MEEDTRFRLVQNKISKNLTLEYQIKYGDRSDQWVSVDQIPDITIDELKKLRDYINAICNKNLI